MKRPGKVGELTGQKCGDYELLALLAVGGTAEIYLARTTGLAGFHKYVVVKRLHDHLTIDSDYTSMFVDEARLGAMLHHTNIAQVLDLGEHESAYYLVMEYLAGMSLALVAKRGAQRLEGSRLPVAITCGLIYQTCLGLHYAHTRKQEGRMLGVVHRDISPQNLVITFEGVLKIVDFGIAKSAQRQVRTKAGTVKGKFAYMSPEQCRASPLDGRSDVFSLGTVMHELLTGHRLFKRDSAYDTYQAILAGNVPKPSELGQGIDPQLDEIVMRALAYSPDERFQSAHDLAVALHNYLETTNQQALAPDIQSFFNVHYQPEIEAQREKMSALLEAFPPVVSEKWRPTFEDNEPTDPSQQQPTLVERPHSSVTTNQGVGELGAQQSGTLDVQQITLHGKPRRSEPKVVSKEPGTVDTRPERLKSQADVDTLDDNAEAPKRTRRDSGVGPEVDTLSGSAQSPLRRRPNAAPTAETIGESGSVRRRRATAPAGPDDETIRPESALDAEQIMNNYLASKSDESAAVQKTAFMESVPSSAGAQTAFMEPASAHMPSPAAGTSDQRTQYMDGPAQSAQPGNAGNQTKFMEPPGQRAASSLPHLQSRAATSNASLPVASNRQAWMALLVFAISLVLSFGVAMAIGRAVL